MATFELYKVESELALHAAYTLMRELRPHLTDAASFIARVHRQAEQGYCLQGVWQDQQLLALAGYRVAENLLYGRFLYVDDLVTAPCARSHGLGAKLIDALRAEARDQRCPARRGARSELYSPGAGYRFRQCAGTTFLLSTGIAGGRHALSSDPGMTFFNNRR